MTDRGRAALAHVFDQLGFEEPYETAAAILGDKAEFLPDGDCGHRVEMADDKMTLDLMEAAIRKDQAEIARLRAALGEAERLALASETFAQRRQCVVANLLRRNRAALDAKP